MHTSAKLSEKSLERAGTNFQYENIIHHDMTSSLVILTHPSHTDHVLQHALRSQTSRRKTHGTSLKHTGVSYTRISRVFTCLEDSCMVYSNDSASLQRAHTALTQLASD
ncbi:hypothetical protein Tco_1173895 [Tanacetum coccineum]